MLLTKLEVKAILNSLRTPYNEKQINLVLARVDMTPEFRLERMIEEYGGDENGVKSYFKENVNQMCERDNENRKYVQINDFVMFKTLNDRFEVKIKLPSNIETLSTEALDELRTFHMLHAIKKLSVFQESLDPNKRKKEIRMFSDGDIDIDETFLQDTAVYTQEELLSGNVMQEDPNVKNAAKAFGTDKTVRFACIDTKTLLSKEFQEMMDRRMANYTEKGYQITESNIPLEARYDMPKELYDSLVGDDKTKGNILSYAQGKGVSQNLPSNENEQEGETR